MPTCTAQMLTDGKTPPSTRRGRRTRLYPGLTLTELIVVVLVVGLFVVMVQTNFFRMIRKSSFKAQARELISTMQMAADAAAQSDKRYEVIIDLTEQSYILREITNSDLTQVLEEEIIASNNFSQSCQVIYVIFDDLTDTAADTAVDTVRALFRAGHAGWQNGGKIVLLDENENMYSVIVNRLSGTILLKEGDVELLLPKDESEVPF